MSQRKGQKTLKDFLIWSHTNKDGEIEPAGPPVDQVCSDATLAEPWVDEAASMGVSSSSAAVAEQPTQCPEWETQNQQI